MGTCYTYLLHLEYYGTWDFDELKIKEDYPYATKLAQWDGWLVIDLDKISPYGDRIQNLQKYCDIAYYYPDTNSGDIQQVEFKSLPKDLVIEANKPENRNTKYIKEAFTEWKMLNVKTGKIS